MCDLFFSTMFKDKILPEKFFKDWNGTKHKWLLSAPCPPPFTKDSTKEEELQ